MRNTIAVWAALMVCAAVAGSAAVGAEVENLVANGDFSVVVGGKPQDWQAAGDARVVDQRLTARKDEQGRGYAELVCTRCDAGSGAAHAMLAQVGKVRLTKGRMYEFTCRARAEGLAGRTVSIGISDTKIWDNCGLEGQLDLGGSWRSYRRIFRATRDVAESSRLQIWFNEPGTLCIGNVRIVEIQPENMEFTDVVSSGGGKNLVANGSFEAGGSGWSSVGQGAGWGNLDRLHGQAIEGDAAEGKRFLRIPMGGEHTPVLYFDYFEPVVRRELRPLATSQGWIKVEPGRQYVLSCFMRSRPPGAAAVLGVRLESPMGGGRDYTARANLNGDWTRYSVRFRAEHRFAYVYAGPNLGNDERADVDVDALQLEAGDAATAYQAGRDVEFTMGPSEAGGVFVAGGEGKLVLRAVNHGAAEQRLVVRFKVADYYDRVADLPAEAITLSGRAAVMREIRIPANWRGYYRIKAIAQAGANTHEADIPIAVVPPRDAKESVCGINHAFASANLIRIASMAGISTYRDWSLKWQHIEPAKGEYRWEVADVQIDRVLREGVSVLPLMPPFPSADWASEAPAGLPTRGYPGVRLKQAYGPKDPAELARFVRDAVDRYKDRIKAWEFLNEPIYTDYSLPARLAATYGGRQYTPADYVSLLKTTAAAMRKADPQCKVIGGIGSGPRQLTREVMEAGILQHIDIFNLHMYPGIRPPEAYAAEMDELLKLMDAHGGRKPIWITEMSYYGADDLPRRPFIPRTGSWSEQRLLADERQCADYTIRYFLVMLSHGVERVFIHSGASGKANDPDFECALLAYGGAPRKLFAAMGTMTQILGPSPRAAGFARFGRSGYVAGFETGRHAVLALWQTDEMPAEPLPVRAQPGWTWRDAMGRETESPPGLSPSPTYLIAPSGEAKQLLTAIGRVG